MEVKNKLENVIWHIETNRLVLGDEKTLNHVLEALKKYGAGTGKRNKNAI
ncbi:hypothetical protein ACT7C1_21295 [Bacillus paranthracis]